MKDNKREGKGIQYCNKRLIIIVDQQNLKYFGQWKNDAAHGLGVFIHNNDSIYVGGWRNNLSNGEGVFFTKEDNIFVGQWADGKLEGNAVWQW